MGRGIEVVSRFFPRVIVKGLQLGVGLLLIKSAWENVSSGHAACLTHLEGGADSCAQRFPDLLFCAGRTADSSDPGQCGLLEPVTL